MFRGRPWWWWCINQTRLYYTWGMETGCVFLWLLISITVCVYLSLMDKQGMCVHVTWYRLCVSMTAEVTPGGFNLGSHQEGGWRQLLWLEFPPATQRFTSCTIDTLPVTVETSPHTHTHKCMLCVHVVDDMWASHWHFLDSCPDHNMSNRNLRTRQLSISVIHCALYYREGAQVLMN